MKNSGKALCEFALVAQSSDLDAPRNRPTAPAAPGSGIKLLVVEDNPINRRVLVRMFETLGYSTDLAANGRQALDLLVQAPYDIVFMNCQMPDMDGFAATAEIRHRERLTRHTVVIAMTAHVLEGDRERCLAAGMDDYLSKPLKLADLERAIQTWQPAAVTTDALSRVRNLTESSIR